VLTVLRVRAVVSEVTKTSHRATHKLAHRGQHGNRGVLALKRVAVASNAELDTASMAALTIVLAMPLKNEHAKRTHVHVGVIGVCGASAHKAAGAVKQASVAAVLMAQQVSAVVLASQVCQARATQNHVLLGLIGANLADAPSPAIAASKLKIASVTMAFQVLTVREHMKTFKCAMNTPVPSGPNGVPGHHVR